MTNPKSCILYSLNYDNSLALITGLYSNLVIRNDEFSSKVMTLTESYGIQKLLSTDSKDILVNFYSDLLDIHDQVREVSKKRTETVKNIGGLRRILAHTLHINN